MRAVFKLPHDATTSSHRDGQPLLRWMLLLLRWVLVLLVLVLVLLVAMLPWWWGRLHVLLWVVLVLVLVASVLLQGLLVLRGCRLWGGRSHV